MSITAHPGTPVQTRFADALRAVGRWIGYGLIALSQIPRARSVAAEYEALSRLPDAALAERGLARERLGWHVFMRHFPDI